MGKTSLARRYVHTIFDDAYHTTIGVKIDQKDLESNGQQVRLMIWDIEGQDASQKVRTSFLRGSNGILYVADRTRRVTLETVVELRQQVRDNVGDLPSVLVLNKADLKDDWDIDENAEAMLRQDGWILVDSSAKRGTGVEEAFRLIADKILEV
ncbi:MAG: small GTP-binding protein [Kiritimatiellia bacterium]